MGSTRTTLTLLDQAVAAYTDATGRPISFGDSADGTFEIYADLPHLYTVTTLLDAIGRSSTVRDYVARIEPRFIVRYAEPVDLGEGLETDPERLKPEFLRVADPDDPNDPAADDAEAYYDAEASGALEGTVAVLDSWGTPIRAVHPGPVLRDAADGVDAAETDADGQRVIDPDGTWYLSVRVLSEPQYLGIATATEAARWAVEAIYGRCRDRRVLFVSAGPDRRFGDVSADPESELFSYTLDNVYSYEIDRSSSTDSGANP